VNNDDEPPAIPDGLVPDREPGPFDTVETWEQWLAEVHTWPSGNTKEYCIWKAKREIVRISVTRRKDAASSSSRSILAVRIVADALALRDPAA
jgi:hypothetical protein